MSTPPLAARPAAGRWIALGALSGLLSVAMGAFAAHGLKGVLSEGALGVLDKGVRYQALHALALVAVGTVLLVRPRARGLGWAAGLFLTGTLLFSGSLYLLALTGVRFWGVVTPFGGLAFLLGWLALALGAWRLGSEGG